MATSEDIQGLANSIGSTDHESVGQEIREEAHKLLERAHALLTGGGGPISPTQAEERAQAAADAPVAEEPLPEDPAKQVAKGSQKA